MLFICQSFAGYMCTALIKFICMKLFNLGFRKFYFMSLTIQNAYVSNVEFELAHSTMGWTSYSHIRILFLVQNWNIIFTYKLHRIIQFIKVFIARIHNLSVMSVERVRNDWNLMVKPNFCLASQSFSAFATNTPSNAGTEDLFLSRSNLLSVLILAFVVIII